MKKNINSVCHLISRCHSAEDLNNYINEYNRKCKRVGEDYYKFGNLTLLHNRYT